MPVLRSGRGFKEGGHLAVIGKAWDRCSATSRDGGELEYYYTAPVFSERI